MYEAEAGELKSSSDSHASITSSDDDHQLHVPTESEEEASEDTSSQELTNTPQQAGFTLPSFSGSAFYSSAFSIDLASVVQQHL